jgi:CHAT domain-containing protein
MAAMTLWWLLLLAGPERLSPGQRLDTALPPGAERQAYELALEAGTGLHVAVKAPGLDVALTVSAPGGGPATVVDDTWTDGAEEVLLVGAPGAYELEVRNKRPLAGAAAPIGIQVSDVRRATAADAARAAAARALSEGKRIFDEQKGDRAQEAMARLAEARDLSRAGHDPRGEALALVATARVEGSLSDYSAAIESLEEALAIWQRLGDLAQQSSALQHAANSFQKLGRLEEAVECAEQALALAREAGSREGELWALLAYSVPQYFQNRLQPALQANERALELARGLRERTGEAEALSNLFTVHYGRGDLQAGVDVLHEALAVSRALNSRFLEAINLNSLGVTYNSLSDPGRARRYLEQALALCRLLGDRAGEAIVLGNLAAGLRLEGEYASAISYMEQSLATREALGDRRGQARNLTSLGNLHLLSGDPGRAREYFERSRALNEADHEVEALILYADLSAALAAGDLDRARELAVRGVEVSARATGVPSPATVHRLARVERTAGELETADEVVELALEVLESQRTQLLSQELRTLLLASSREIYGFHAEVLMARHAARPAAGFDRRAFEAAERARARGLLELIAESRADIREGVDPTLLDRERELRDRLSKATARALRGRPAEADKAAAEAQRRELEDLTTELERLEAEIRKRSPRYAALARPEPITVPALQALLDDDTQLVEYALGNDASHAWVVGRRSLVSAALPPRAAIEDAAQRVLAAMESESAGAPAAAAELSRMVLAPLGPHLTGRRLLVVADGALQYVPFAALPRPGSTEALVVRHELVSLPSASTVPLLRAARPARAAASRTVAVLADPVFDAGDERLGRSATPRAEARLGGRLTRASEDAGLAGPIPRLPFTRREAQAILAAVPAGSSRAALGFEASRETLLDPEMGRYRVIHLATHGFLNASRPELSGVLLSLVDREGRPQPGFLTAADAHNLKLSADLVVLSGCRTAMGKQVNGEGIVGLTRGFMYAGADRVLASIWRVDDAATAALMSRFYSAMLGPRRLSPAAALRTAQLELMKQPRYRHPFFWAAFQLQGEWR